MLRPGSTPMYFSDFYMTNKKSLQLIKQRVAKVVSFPEYIKAKNLFLSVIGP